MTIDFICRQVYYLDHAAPIWNAMPPAERGVFYLNDPSFERAQAVLKGLTDKNSWPYIEKQECGHGPILAFAYGDAVRAADADPSRPVILFEHGIGLTFGKAAYADGDGQRGKISLFLVPSQYVKNKAHPNLKDKPRAVIGMPKLDPWAGEFNKPHPMPKNPTIAIGFHHGDKNSRPGVVGSAWEHYESILPELAGRYKLILHAHPMANQYLTDIYEHLQAEGGAEIVPDFQEVMRRADLYINDCSSTAYEFLVTGKPVILLNAPWFDLAPNFGIRFWDYSDIGPMVEDPGSLLPAIEHIVANPDEFRSQRSQAVRDLLPYVGKATDKALDEIRNFINGIPKPRHAPDVRNAPEWERWTEKPVAVPVLRKKGDKGMRRFFISRNLDSDYMFYKALLSAGYVEVDHPSLSEFIIHDAVHPGLERYLDSQPVFITPHTPQSSFLWDGILDVFPVCCNFVYGEAAVKTMKAYGYPYRVEAVGFGRCQVRKFQPEEGRDLLIVPAHPSRKGQYPNPGYLDLVWDMLMRILKERDCFGKITLCWSEERINPDVLRGMQQKNVEHIVANPWTDPEPLKHMIDQIEAADLVLSCNTTGCVAVARGKPTVFFSEGAPSSNPKAALHPEKYHHFLKFPLQAENMTIDDILAVRRKPNEQVEVWKEQNIGGNFNAAKFLGIIREYIPS